MDVTTWTIAAAATIAGVWGAVTLANYLIRCSLRAPRVPHAAEPGAFGVPPNSLNETRIRGPRGKHLFGWFVTPDEAARRPMPAVLVIHGWGANAAMMSPVVAPLRSAGFAVLLIDARCHGRSDGEAFTSMPRFAEDIAAGLAWLRAAPDVDRDRIALIGHSVGAGAALLHASRFDDVRAVISVSAFAHPGDVMRRLMAAKRVPQPVAWYVLRYVQRVIGVSFDDIAPLHTLSRVRCPVLLVHGRADSTVPFSDAERLQMASRRATLLAVDGDHDLRESLAPHIDALVTFLDHAFRSPESGGDEAAGGAVFDQGLVGHASKRAVSKVLGEREPGDGELALDRARASRAYP